MTGDEVIVISDSEEEVDVASKRFRSDKNTPVRKTVVEKGRKKLSQTASSSASTMASSSSSNIRNSVSSSVTPSGVVESAPEVEVDDGFAEMDNFELLGSSVVACVGIRYYTGIVNRLELVNLVREPTNRYDKNAIRVDNVLNQQVGHVKGTQAAVLAPLIDSGALQCEAKTTRNVNTAYSISLTVDYYSSAENVADLTRKLSRAGLYQNSSQSYHGGATQSPKASERVTQTRMTVEKQKNVIENIFDELAGPENLPTLEASPLLKTMLYSHQKQALFWMVQRERAEPSSVYSTVGHFYEKKTINNKLTFVNKFTNTATVAPPKESFGGILADDMGLGKTVSTIAVILSDLKMDVLVNPALHSSEPNEGNKKKLKRRHSSNFRKPSKPQNNISSEATIIIAPLSTIGNWTDQLMTHSHAKHVQWLGDDLDDSTDQEKEDDLIYGKRRLKFYVYHGHNRIEDPHFLASQDVIITTYETVAFDWVKDHEDEENKTKKKSSSAKKKKKNDYSTLQCIHWKRIVLDEGHLIANPRTRKAKAIYSLPAQKRWVLSGTPIQNKVNDLYSLANFLKLEPFNDLAWWNRIVSRPIRNGKQEGFTNLQIFMKSVSLRRTKTTEVNGKRITDLPPVTNHIVKLQFSQEEKEKYDQVFEVGVRQFERLSVTDTVFSNYVLFLELLLRLRQICAHPHLCKNVDFGEIFKKVDKLEGFDVDRAMKLLHMLEDAGENECCVCLEEMKPETSIVTSCSHLFCQECIRQVIHQQAAKCPLCRGAIDDKSLITAADVTKRIEELSGGVKEEVTGENNDAIPISTKIKALIQDLQSDECKGEKVVVFSQWTSFLDLMKAPLTEKGIAFTDIRGSMSRVNREKSLEQFKENDACRVLLISLKAGGVGLNLTHASRVYLMDPWWNPSVELQAQDRVHRLGQKKPVNVYRFVMQGSVEERFIDIQNSKSELAKITFQTPKDKQREIRMHHLSKIFSRK